MFSTKFTISLLMTGSCLIGIVLGIGVSQFALSKNSSPPKIGTQRLDFKQKPRALDNISSGRSIPNKNWLGTGTQTLESVSKIYDALERALAFASLGVNAAKSNLKKAFLTIEQLESEKDRKAFTRGIFHFLGQSNDNKAALAQIANITNSNLREVAFEQLATDWGLDQLFGAAFYSHRTPAINGSLLLKMEPPQTELALAWAEQLKSSEGKATLLGEIGEELLLTSPASALDLANRLQGEEYVTFLDTVTRTWARLNPEAALAWSEQIPDPILKANLQNNIAENWTTDTEKAQARLATMPPGQVRDALLKSVAERLANNDTAAAFKWQAALSNPVESARAYKIIQDTAPVGIGVNFIISNGLPTITSVISNTPAALNRQINFKDRILAVDSTGNGKFVSTMGLKVQEVTSLIKGKIGTPLRLQISSITADGFGPPRTIQLTRAQILQSSN